MDDPGVGLFSRRSERLGRWVQFGMAGGRVIKVDFLVEQPDGTVDDHPLLDQLERYLDDGEPVNFTDVDVALTGPTDHRPVYETVRGVPYGTDVTVREVAGGTAQLPPDDEGERTVREALGANPIPILIPDHRVRDDSGSTPSDIRDTLRSIEGLV